MDRVLEHLFCRPGLYQVAGVHDVHPVRNIASGRDVMGYVEQRHPLIVAKTGHDVEQADPDGNVEHGHGLVCQDQLGLVRQRLSEPDALALTPRESHVGTWT